MCDVVMCGKTFGKTMKAFYAQSMLQTKKKNIYKRKGKRIQKAYTIEAN